MIKSNVDNSHKPQITSILKKKSREFLLNQNLLKSVQIGDLAKVEQYIADGATLHRLSDMQLHKYNSEHDSLLHIAVQLGHVDIVKFLISQKVDVNIKNRRLRSPLHYATHNDVPLVIIDFFLNKGADLEIKDDDNASPFMWACYLNNVPVMEKLILHCPDLYAIDNFNLSPLEWASHQGNLEAVKFLIANVAYSKVQIRSAYVQSIENGQTNTAVFLEQYL